MEPPSEPSVRPAERDEQDITRLLHAWSDGDDDAFERLLPLVYDDLRAIAHNRLESERSGHTLQTTALVHEAYMRLADAADIDWTDRAHFFAIASRVVRRVLVDYARRSRAEKRGGGATRVELAPGMASADSRAGVHDVLALDDALSELARHDPRLERVVEHRFFGGMSVKETAAVLGVSERTVERDWRRARTYLYRALRAEQE